MRGVIVVIVSALVGAVGAIAVGLQGQQVKPSLNSTAANKSFDVAHHYFAGSISIGNKAVIVVGFTAALVLAIGVLIGRAS